MFDDLLFLPKPIWRHKPVTRVRECPCRRGGIRSVTRPSGPGRPGCPLPIGTAPFALRDRRWSFPLAPTLHIAIIHGMRRFAGINRAQPVEFFLSVAIGSLKAAPTCKFSELPQRQQNIASLGDAFARPTSAAAGRSPHSLSGGRRPSSGLSNRRTQPTSHWVSSISSILRARTRSASCHGGVQQVEPTSIVSRVVHGARPLAPLT